jgi:hypothetical protein
LYKLKAKLVKMENQWVPIKGYEGYFIHPIHGVGNPQTNQLLSGYIQKNGYPTVKLQRPGKTPKLLKIHRLMAEAFVHNPNPEKFTIVNHKDGNKLNCAVENLEWVSASGNCQHAVDTGLRKFRTKGRPMDILDRNGNIIHVCESIIKAAEYVGCSERTINDHLANRTYPDGTIYVKKVVLRQSAPPPDLEGEIWTILKVSIETSLDKFELSTYGRLRFAETKHHVLTNPIMGYPAVNMLKTQMYIHRLMAFTYLNPPEEKFDVNHIDKDPTNNKLSNLEVLMRGDHLIKDHGKPVLCKKIGETDMVFPSISKAAEFLGVTVSCVPKSVNSGGTCMGWNCYFIKK